VKRKKYPYNKWDVKIMDFDLGVFETFEEAVITRLKAEKEYYGDFAPQKHLFAQYGII
jgi:hypothetical protein